ncbi:hypothetical protein GCM10009837_50700 [Streptomyces durmitorensis]|uniref:DUF998 domain-containing protein n=1 Tax=Streptomyces durmitorensis TaxID=319947 RepID=A0ABY4Q0I9_9ACTN|nr:DUF998 domain-containing protein [Streptomyces durmitorensis]UQT58900.1 DUF998 domain-containing protein [Streptomyces durmitorensis]
MPITPAEPRPATARAAAVSLLLVLGALAYSAWLLEPLLGTGLSPVSSYVSELAARDQPFGALFRTTDLTAGLLLLAGAVCALLWLPRRRIAVVGWAGLALFGAATAVDSRLPLSCAPTADAACVARERAGLVPAAHTAHVVSSSVAMTGALVGMVALTFAARRYGHGVLPSLAAPFGLLLLLLELAATAWTLAAVAAFDAGHGTWALGVGQRLQVLLIALWLGLLARAVVRRG